MHGLKTVAFFSALTFCSSGRAQTEITVYTYNDRTPFVVDKAKNDGLEFRLCDWLSMESKGRFHFSLKVTTAQDIRAQLESNKLQGIVMGVNAAWFSEKISKNALWTPPILFDKNCVISMISRKVDYSGPASLVGRRVAVVKAWNYPAHQEDFKSGKATRVDFDTEPQALRGLAAGKADVAIVSEWTYLYEQLRGDLQGDFYTADKPDSAFARSVLVPASQKELYDQLCKTLTDVKSNPGWQKATGL